MLPELSRSTIIEFKLVPVSVWFFRSKLGNRPVKGKRRASEPARADSASTEGVMARGLVWEELQQYRSKKIPQAAGESPSNSCLAAMVEQKLSLTAPPL